MGTAVLAIALVVGIPLIMAFLAWSAERPAVARPPAVRRDSATTATVLTAVLWAALTALGLYVAATVDIYPLIASDKGEEIDHAFRVLAIASVPVMALVLAVLLYVIVRRGHDALPEDGPALRDKGAVPVAWFAITAGLTAVIMVYPGLTSLSKVIDLEDEPDLLVHVEGLQWTWLVSYPELGVSNVRDLKLPVDRTVKFEITSRDVLHSFWVPAFLMKIDAVPGLTTRLSLRPEVEASFDTDPTVRLQCAELCGLSHTNMTIPVEVVSRSEFDAWIEERAKAQAAAAAGGPAPTFTLVAKDLKFDAKEITVEVGKAAVILVDNQDAGVLHNLAIYLSESSAKKSEPALFASQTLPGPVQERLQLTMEKAGTFFFRCDVHPTTMAGKLIAK